MFGYLLPLLLALLIIAYLFGQPYYIAYQRQQITHQPFPAPWRKIIKQRMPYFNKMPTDLQLQLKKHIQIFVAEKQFVGFQGIKINDDIKVTVAAQACLLLLNRKTDYYPQLKTIAIFPDAFVKQHMVTDSIGVQQHKSSVLLGESWQFGRVILSWQHTLAGAKMPNDGTNVVIHEFAHQLDQETGFANGAPRLSRRQGYQRWSKVLEKEYQRLKRRSNEGQVTLLDSYGATDPAEFFAVASEVFFEQAEQMFHQHQALYQQLKGLYQVDPVNWH